jgi:hypothetical protein
MDDESTQFELAAVMAALGMGLPQSEKEEFMTAAHILLGQFPAGLAREALHESLTNVDSLRKVLPFVKAYCEDYPQRLARHRDRLVALQAHVQGRGNV